MAEQYLIDGYNLLYALRSISPQKNPLSREELFTKLSGFASLKQSRVIVVIDGSGDDSEQHAYATSFFNVVLSQNKTADAFIEKYLYDFKAQHSFVVVTADRAITHIARGSGAMVLSPSQFWEMVCEMDTKKKDILWEAKKKEHGFNRPFEDKLKDHE